METRPWFRRRHTYYFWPIVLVCNRFGNPMWHSPNRRLPRTTLTRDILVPRRFRRPLEKRRSRRNGIFEVSFVFHRGVFHGKSPIAYSETSPIQYGKFLYDRDENIPSISSIDVLFLEWSSNSSLGVIIGLIILDDPY